MGQVFIILSTLSFEFILFFQKGSLITEKNKEIMSFLRSIQGILLESHKNY